MAEQRRVPERPVPQRRMNEVRTALGPIVAELKERRDGDGRALSHVEIHTAVCEYFATHGDGSLPTPRQWHVIWRQFAST